MIRTWDPQIRNLVLYPTELPGQTAGDCSKLRAGKFGLAVIRCRPFQIRSFIVHRIIYLSILAFLTTVAACGSEEAAEPSTSASSESSVTADQSAAGDSAAAAAATVSADYMRGIVVEISDDSYEGRGPGSRGK